MLTITLVPASNKHRFQVLTLLHTYIYPNMRHIHTRPFNQLTLATPLEFVEIYPLMLPSLKPAQGKVWKVQDAKFYTIGINSSKGVGWLPNVLNLNHFTVIIVYLSIIHVNMYVVVFYFRFLCTNPYPFIHLVNIA